MEIKRCNWTKDNPVNNEYHDKEWGVPVHDDLKLFEFLVLDSFQAGLSWLTILKKRGNFEKAFDYFDPHKISQYNAGKIEELMNDKGIIRNKLKILATINNASAFIEVQKQYGSFDKYIWQFTGNKTIHNYWSDFKQVPSKTKVSDAMCIDLKKKGFKFLGSTICYAFMQGAGMVNDHLTTCFRHSQILTFPENISHK
jgi:DNA-3-methyladenine glycosylase I